MAPVSKDDTDHFEDIRGVTLHYNEAGSGPTLICTHGGGPWANAWDNSKWIFDDLAANFHTILLDAPGFGESQKDVDREGTPLDIYCAEIIVGLMDKMNIERTHIHGSAAYGATALRLAIDYPERVGKIILTCANIGRSVPGIPDRGVTPGQHALHAFSDHPTRENLDLAMEYFAKRPEFKTAEIGEMRYQAATRPGAIEGRLKMRASTNSDLTDLLPGLRAQTLIIWGNEDELSYVEGALRSLRSIPNSRAVIFGDQSGHFVFQEHPKECAQLITAFLMD